MSTPGPDDSPPQSPDELGGLDPKDLFNAGLATVPPVTLPPQPVDPDATVRVTPSSTGIKLEARKELPLPDDLTALLPGGNYHVESFLGQGGMGAVYKGTQVRLKRPVAIKIMRRDFGQDHDFEARFEREAQAMAKLNHPNIVSVIDFGEAGPDYLYIVMELVDGADMMDVIRTGRMTQEMALTLLPQICDALQFAHDHGIVHRDIKPSNIMLTRDGRIKMADFGLAKRFDTESSFRTQTGTGMGTPDYAAPEQFDPNSQIDHRADIYALGVMIYQMITGSLPRGVWKPPSQRAEVAPQWDDIVGRAMQNDPADRYQKATEVKTDVSSISLAPVAQVSDLGGAKPSTQPDAPPPASLRRATTKSRAPLLVGIAATALVLGIVAFFALRGKQSGDELEPAPASTAPSVSKSTQAATAPAANAGGDGLKPGTTLAATPPAIAATLLPESGWKPLFTDEQWRQNVPGRMEFIGGLLHLTHHHHNKEFSGADGAIRANIRIRKDISRVGVHVRISDSEGGYFLVFNDPNPDGTQTVGLKFYPAVGSNGVLLGEYKLPVPPRVNDVVQLELRALGDHLQAFVNGVAAVDAHDNRVKAVGKWGISAEDAWFESVEVQPLPAAAVSPSPNLPASKSSAAAEPWQDVLRDPSKLTLSKASIAPDGLHVEKGGWLVGREKIMVKGDGALRMKVSFAADSNPHLCARSPEDGTAGYELSVVDPAHVSLDLREGNKRDALREFLVSPPLIEGEDYELELRVVGSTLSAKLNGVVLGEVEHTALSSGVFKLNHGHRPVVVKALSFLPLSRTVKAAPSPTLPVSKSSDPKFPPGQWVKLFTKPEDLPADLRKPDSGVTWEDGAINSSSTFSQRIPLRQKNQAIRLTTSPAARFQLRLRDKTGDDFYELSSNGALSHGSRVDSSIKLAELSKPVEGLAPATDTTWQLAVIGTQLIARRNGVLIGNVQDTRIADGNPSIANAVGTFRDIEVINLDGLPEAEALRLLGVDEQGNDLRGKERSADTPVRPGTSGGAAATNNQAGKSARAPVSSPLPWRSAFGKPLSGLATAEGSRTFKDGWLEIRDRLPPLPVSHRTGMARLNLEWRAPVQGMALGLNSTEIELRLSGTEAVLRPVGSSSQDTVSLKLPTPLKVGDPVELQIAWIGGRIYGWFQGQSVGDLPMKPGKSAITAVYCTKTPEETLRLRSFDICDLDGLPEAEALRLLGVDEKGNDLRGKSASTEPWQDAVGTPGLLRVAAGPPADRPTTGGLVLQHQSSAVFDDTASDGAIRVVGTYGSSNIALRARMSIDGTTQYMSSLQGPTKANLGLVVDGKATLLKDFELPRTLRAGEEYSLELRVTGQSLRVTFDGRILGEVTNAVLSTGRFGLSNYTGQPIPLRKVEYLPLTSPRSDTPAAATKEAPFTNTLGMKFVPVPGTKVLFSIWETRVQDYEPFAKAENANDGWQRQVKYGEPVTHEPTEPVCGVAWQDAAQFCQWLTNKERAEGKLPEGMEYRLPMDEEWSCAIGLTNESGTTPKERNHQNQSHFDCGASFPPKTMKVGNYADAAFHAKFPDKPWLDGYMDGFAMAAPVGSFPPNEFGLYDLGGNVMEWCQDLFDPAGTDRFLRGTNWNSIGRDNFLSSHRTPREPLSRYPEHGFRCVLTPVPTSPP